MVRWLAGGAWLGAGRGRTATGRTTAMAGASARAAQHAATARYEQAQTPRRDGRTSAAGAFPLGRYDDRANALSLAFSKLAVFVPIFLCGRGSAAFRKPLRCCLRDCAGALKGKSTHPVEIAFNAPTDIARSATVPFAVSFPKLPDAALGIRDQRVEERTHLL